MMTKGGSVAALSVAKISLNRSTSGTQLVPVVPRLPSCEAFPLSVRKTSPLFHIPVALIALLFATSAVVGVVGTVFCKPAEENSHTQP